MLLLPNITVIACRELHFKNQTKVVAMTRMILQHNAKFIVFLKELVILVEELPLVHVVNLCFD